MGIFDTAKGYLAARKFKQSTLGQALELHTQEYFYEGIALSHFSQANKDKLIADFMPRSLRSGRLPIP